MWVCMCVLHVCGYTHVLLGVYVHLTCVLVPIWERYARGGVCMFCVCAGTHMGGCACGGPRSMSGITLHCSPTLCTDAGCPSQTHISQQWLVLLISLILGSSTAFQDWNHRLATTLTWHFSDFLGSKLQPSSLHAKHFYH